MLKQRPWGEEPPSGKDSLPVTIEKTALSSVKMKLLLLCLGLTLSCASKEGIPAVVRSNLDIPKISGEWYSILLASDVKEKIEENGSMRVFVEQIHVLANSSLLFILHTKVNGVCAEISLVCDEAGEEGVYTFNYDGDNTFYVLETNYTDYVILYLVNVSSDVSFQLLELYGREPDLSPRLKKKFVKICQKYGIVEENIIDLTNVDRCLEARGSEVTQAYSYR
ncbi:epididymal-specific lipocalin-9 [Hippopotamus amphibius kiboko]|uniref:epididymal-specific lipocalin-9 n=1 Tax=Hippopotamus amphibius kiboko TaxID=575201 RepID=UPI0025959D9F|nr:epididymal-specific lipocalin-9 [Hippopotamus amphibius kiboko]